jgi:hypothetical protein
MTDEPRLREMLRSAMPPSTDGDPSRDLWPMVERKSFGWPTWSWIDLGLTAATALAVLLIPDAWFLLAYHF